MKKIRDFAREVGCTPQNIYLHLDNYAEELEGHIYQGNRGKLLDDFACDFIRGLMNPKEIVADEQLQQDLAKVRSQLMLKLAEVTDLEQQLSKLTTEHYMLQQEFEKQGQLLLTSQEEEQKTAAALEELTKARAELQVEHDGLKGRYDELQESNNNLVKNYEDLTERFQEEKNRKLSWKERFTGRKDGQNQK